VKRVPKFNKDSEAFQNFDDGISRDTTRRIYHYYLNEMMRFVEFERYDQFVELSTDEIHELLKGWIRSMKDKKLRHKTIKNKLFCAELFFDMNKKIIYKKLLHKMLPDSDEIAGGDVPFTTDELWAMKQAAKKPRDVAIIDFLASTGVRPGSLMDPVLKLKHLVEMPNGCKGIKVYDDSNEGYWAFLTPEASNSLNRYLNSRVTNGEKLDQESVLFKNYDNPNKKNEYLSDNSIRQMLDNFIKLAGVERTKTGFRYDKAIVYGFRKRFNTILKIENEVNSNIAEKLMGHKRGYDGSYLKPTKEKCFEEFEKAIYELTLDPTERQKVVIREKEKELSEIAVLKTQVISLEEKNESVEQNKVTLVSLMKEVVNLKDEIAEIKEREILITTAS